jgi:hypothetical protein
MVNRGDVRVDNGLLVNRLLGCSHVPGNDIDSGFDLGMDYYNFTSPIVDEQLAKGGIRLAYLLNNVFAGMCRIRFCVRFVVCIRGDDGISLCLFVVLVCRLWFQ